MLATIGGALLFLGWFCFNAGSAFAANSVAASAASTTIVGSSVSSIVFVVLSLIHAEGKPTVTVSSILNGMLAGLAGITPASGFISPSYAIPVSIIISVASFYSMHGLKALEIDDVLDVSSIHGVSGIVGSIAVGFFGDSSINPEGLDGVIKGSGYLLGIQLLAITVSTLWAMLMTAIFATVISRMLHCSPHYRRHLRVSVQAEHRGLDSTYGHGHADLEHDGLPESGQPQPHQQQVQFQDGHELVPPFAPSLARQPNKFIRGTSFAIGNPSALLQSDDDSEAESGSDHEPKNEAIPLLHSGRKHQISYDDHDDEEPFL